MTNSIAIALVLLIAAIFTADLLALDLDLPLLIARELNALIEYLSFWR